MSLTYPTTTDHDVLHRREHGSNEALCGTTPLQGVECQTAVTGLEQARLVMCLACVHSAAARGYPAYGCAPADWEHPQVQAAVQALEIGGHDGAVMENGVQQARAGFLVQPRVGGGVTVMHLADDDMVTGGNTVGEEEEEWQFVVDGYEHTLIMAGWLTSWLVKSEDRYTIQAVPGREARD